MPAYVIIDIEITDPERYQVYLRQGTIAAAANGATFLVRGGNPETIEGDRMSKRMVVLQFKDRAAALKWYDSPEYREARRLRAGAAKFQAIVVDGAPA